MHLHAPCRVGKHRLGCVLPVKSVLIAGIENRPKVGLVGHQDRGLQAADLVGLPKCSRWVQRGVEGEGALGVKAPSTEISASSGQGFTRLDRVQGAIGRPCVAPIFQRHQAKTPASTASIYSRTCCALPSRTSCMAVRPPKPGRGSERYHA